jgi:DNA-binding LytR/AlgR family response regulator
MVGIIEGYRFVIRRMQGEASLLDPNEEEPVATALVTDRFLVKKLGREFLVGAAEIEFARAAGNYVNLHVRGREYPIRSTIAELENKLDRACFVRVHRSYVVNINWIASIEPIENGDARLHLNNQMVIPCSRTYRNEIKALIN